MGEAGQLGAVDSLWFFAWMGVDGGFGTPDWWLGAPDSIWMGVFGEVRDARWVVGGARFTLDGSVWTLRWPT